MKMMEQNNGKLKGIVKKILPVSSLILLTLLLMIFFRHKKQDIGKFLEQGKNNLVSFYAQNLQPLFTTTDITNEDVFNFALYNSLPIDKGENKVLTISNQSGNNQVYEVKPLSYNSGTNNYQKFVEYLGLNSSQKDEADSILNLYKKELYLSVLMNDKNTIAVSSKISELQKAALADILNFARKVDAQKAWDIFPVQQGWDNDVKNFIVSAKENTQNEFFFITPDTAFKTICTINPDELNKAVDEKIKLSDSQKQWSANASANWGFDFHFSQESNESNDYDKNTVKHNISIQHPDSNSFKIIIPIPEIPQAPSFVKDSIRIKLDQAAKRLRKLAIAFNHKEFDKSSKKKLTSSKNSNGEEYYFEDPTEIISKTIEIISQKNFKDWEDFGHKMDSIAEEFGDNYSNSMLKRNKAVIEEYKKLNKTKPKTPDVPKTPDKVN